MRLIREHFNPELKCARVGHDKEIDRQVEGYILPCTGFRGVADSFVGTMHTCKRCGVKLRDMTIDNRDAIHELTMPDSYWRKLENKGILILRSYK